MTAARACLLALGMCWAVAAAADVAVPPLSGRVVDQTGTLSSGDIASLTQTLKNLQARKGSQVAVLIVPTTEPETIEQYSIRVAETWKIGRKKIDDGACCGCQERPQASHRGWLRAGRCAQRRHHETHYR